MFPYSQNSYLVMNLHDIAGTDFIFIYFFIKPLFIKPPQGFTTPLVYEPKILGHLPSTESTREIYRFNKHDAVQLSVYVYNRLRIYLKALTNRIYVPRKHLGYRDGTVNNVLETDTLVSHHSSHSISSYLR